MTLVSNLFCFSWSYGLLFHQGIVDLARSAILIPLGKKIICSFFCKNQDFEIALHITINTQVKCLSFLYSTNNFTYASLLTIQELKILMKNTIITIIKIKKFRSKLHKALFIFVYLHLFILRWSELIIQWKYLSISWIQTFTYFGDFKSVLLNKKLILFPFIFQ